MIEVEVRARYVKRDGSPASGTVSFTPRSGGVSASENTLFPRTPVRAALDEQGEFTVQLQATDDPDAEPVDWTYVVAEWISGAPQRSYDIEVPASAAGTGIDLADVAPVPMSTGDIPTLTSFGLSLVTSPDAPAARSALGLGTAATVDVSAFDVAGSAAAAQAAAVAEIGILPAATADGVADDRAAVLAADVAAASAGRNIILRPGTYRIATSLDVNSPVVLHPGAVIKPDNGATVRLRGGCVAPRRQVFDHSAGGVVAPQKVEFYHPAWWGPIGTADDTATWQAMNSALSAGGVSQSSVPFTQRVMAPAGLNRILGLALANCDLYADKGNVIFAPPSSATSGVMLRLNDYVTVHGGYFTTTATGHAVTLIDHQGYRTQIDNAYVVPAAANSIGINLGAGATVTPVLNDCRIIGGTKAAGSKGLVVNSADAQITNLWVATVGVGIEWLRGVANVVNMHVWGCTTGMSGTPDGACWVNVFLDTNDGWGADLENLDRASIKNLMVWGNGAGTASTGGMRVRQVGGLSCRGTRVEGIIDDNTGVGLLLDGCTDYDLDLKVTSRSVQAGGPAVTDTAVRVASNCLRTNVDISGVATDVVTALLDDLSTSSAVEFASVKRVLAANVVYNNSTTFTNLFSVPVQANQRWLIEGMLIVDGHSNADLKCRLQATSSTGATGWFGLDNAAGTSATSPTNADMNPVTARAVATSAGAASVSGLIAVGSLQMIGFKGYVVTGSAAGSLDLQTAQQAADPTNLTIAAGSWMRATRIA